MMLAYRFCRSNECGNFGTNERGSCGCLLLNRPCDLLDRLRVAVACPADKFSIDGGTLVLANPIDQPEQSNAQAESGIA